MNDKLQRLIDLLESVQPPVEALNPPLIAIVGEDLVCWTGPGPDDGESYPVTPDMRNQDVWIGLNLEGL